MTDAHTRAEEVFRSYPEWLADNPRCLSGGSCRTGYGLVLQQITGQTECAYCDLSMIDTYEHWLLMSVDHVIPDYMAKRPGWREWVDNANNMVICCLTCNGFLNGYRLKTETQAPTSFAEFVTQRNEVFEEKAKLAKLRHTQERDFHSCRPWEREISPDTLPRRS